MGKIRQKQHTVQEDVLTFIIIIIIVRVIKSRTRWARHVARMEGGVCTRFWWGNLRGKRPLGRPRRRWEDNINMDLQEVGRGCGDWMELAQDMDR